MAELAYTRVYGDLTVSHDIDVDNIVVNSNLNADSISIKGIRKDLLWDGKAESQHSHTTDQITNFPTSMEPKYTPIPSGANLNNYTTIGFYGTAAAAVSVTNRPSGVSGFSLLVMKRGIHTNQVICQYQTDSPYMWTRSLSEATWGSWFKIPFTGDLMTLGETSTTAYRGDRGKTAYGHSQDPHAYLPLAGGTLTGELTTNGYIKTTLTEQRLSTPHGYISLGPKNTSHAHIYTDRPSFYFNKPILVNGTAASLVGHTHSYDNYSNWKIAASGTAGTQNITSGSTMTIQGGSGINVTRSGSTVTISSSNSVAGLLTFTPTDTMKEFTHGLTGSYAVSLGTNSAQRHAYYEKNGTKVKIYLDDTPYEDTIEVSVIVQQL